jgi:hypothetical protein
MKGYLIQAMLYPDIIKDLIEKKDKIITLGKEDHILGHQPPPFDNTPLTFCSYYCEGYKQSAYPRGVIIEIDEPIAYACPADSFEILRGGNWVPGHEKFIFKSIEEMLEKYPTSIDFKKYFKKYFAQLNYKEVYPNNEPRFAETLFETDYTKKFFSNWQSLEACNEITFRKPIEAKLVDAFVSEEELHEKMKDLGI